MATAGEGAERIESISGIQLSNSQNSRVMVRLGMTLRTCAAVPDKADPQMQFEFLKDELLSRLEETRDERSGFFVDVGAPRPELERVEIKCEKRRVSQLLAIL